MPDSICVIAIRHFLLSCSIYIPIVNNITIVSYGREGGTMYQKEIIYIGLYKNGNRLGSAGFLKVENRERESRLCLKIQNIPLGISGRFPIRVHNGNEWKEINGIMVQDGGGSWQEDLMGTADRVILQVMLPGEYYLEGRSRTAVGMTAQGKPDTVKEIRTVKEADTAKEKNTVKAVDAAKEIGAVREADAAKEKSTVRVEVAVKEEAAVGETDAVKEKSVAKEMDIAKEKSAAREESAARKTSAQRETIIIKEELPRTTTESTFTVPQSIPEHSLKEDKWEQILDTYENIHPYGDERVYVKLEPKDFVILQSKYQHLVNNSFLLHGFYNYRYIILGKEQDYYLGVPGVFYEREKMVALMFGFEAFECPGGNVKAGEFGYYLRKVEI